MNKHSRKHLPLLIAVAFLFAAVFCGLAGRSSAQPLSANETLQEAWHLVQASGTYEYHSQIEQVTYPAPKLANTGRELQAVFAQVDSAHSNQTYRAVYESHEGRN